ncbi:MAG TPA: serine--tRNA ligase, partial [Planctomycetota bacterium]|nr:serine--tRNA ligase [Planctomycetota bacterium]
MLDPKRIREAPDAVKAGARKKRIPADALVDRFIELDEKRRKLAFERDELKANQNRAGKDMARLQGEERDKLRKEMGALSARAKELDAELQVLETEIEGCLLRIPNLP